MSNLVYHGTVYNFNLPSLSKCKDRKDFGKGFYLSEDINHARSVAERGYVTNGFIGTRYIYSYRIDISEMRRVGLKIHQFNSANYSWLDFIIKNRNMLDVENYDVVIGPTADKKVQVILSNLYKTYGMNLTNEEKNKIIQSLNVSRYGKQYCFKTQRALNYLNSHFCERRIF